jgi:2-C-methyl-D-erythritol 4-phosphate cytidylyltransferase
MQNLLGYDITMKEKRIGAIIVAAGKGERMKSRLPKQFVSLANKPVFIYSLEKFQHAAEIDDIILVVPQDYIEHTKHVLQEFFFSKVHKIVAGGIKRQDSVYNGLKALDINKYEIFIIHDAVRPFVEESIISQVIDQAKKKGAAIAAISAVDTIKEITANGRIVKTLERNKLVQVQTPQAFQTEILLKAFQLARREGFYGTDEAALVERLGNPVYIVESSPNNIKITTENDLRLAKAIVSENP